MLGYAKPLPNLREIAMPLAKTVATGDCDALGISLANLSVKITA
jgi:hypothetical protein